MSSRNKLTGNLDARSREICIQMAAGNIDSVDALHLMQERIDALVASYEAKVQDFAAETLRTGELTAHIDELETTLAASRELVDDLYARIAELEALLREIARRKLCTEGMRDRIDALGTENPSSHE